MPVMSVLKPAIGQSRKEYYIQIITLVGRLSFLLRIFKGVFISGYREIRARGLSNSFAAIYVALKNYVVRLMLALPSSKAKLKAEMGKTRSQLRQKVHPASYPDGINLTVVKTLPTEGKSREWLEEEWKSMKRLQGDDVGSGRVSGTVYHGGEELNEIINTAMNNFLLSNPLHSDIFPSVRKMESEIISICLNLFNCPQGAGTTTSGGTESILMAVKTYRDWAKATKGITSPEMVVPASAHAAFFKAAQYFGIKIRVIPVNEKTRRADVDWISRAINANTIMIVASAPNFPDGIIDPIKHLGAIAKKKKIGFHVDCCLGSFLMPFLEKAGLGDGVDAFDFSVPGVTSVSCDIHKYAFCPKGSSVIMYRSVELRRYQYYVNTDWSGGVYASPSMAGSRPGAIIAGAWAVLNHIGANGYTDSCKTIVIAARTFAAQLKTRFPTDLYVLGNPRVSVVAFASKTINIYALGDAMSKKGWHLNGLMNPPALHMAFTLPTSNSVDKLLDDLAEVIQQVKTMPKGEEGNMVALYGVGQTSVGPVVVEELVKTYLDVLYE